jgi:pimeloyl-ACP methyl ester carboxylesterase
MIPAVRQETVSIKTGGVLLEGDLAVPPGAAGIVLFAHGSGSSRHSRRNRFVAEQLQARRIATLLFDLLTEEEEAIDEHTAHLRFDIELLAIRLTDAAAWVAENPETRDLPAGYFGASTGAAAALLAAAHDPRRVAAVVSRGGRADLAGPALGRVRAPTLLIVGSADTVVLELNEKAYRQLRCAKEMEIVPGASHLFEEPGALEQVADFAAAWFTRWLHDPDVRQGGLHSYDSG